jgi:hypothetical protein
MMRLSTAGCYSNTINEPKLTTWRNITLSGDILYISQEAINFFLQYPNADGQMSAKRVNGKIITREGDELRPRKFETSEIKEEKDASGKVESD